MRLIRLPEVLSRTGRGRSSHYGDIARGLMTSPVEIGPGARAWPDEEIDAIIRTRIAGRTSDEVRALVTEMISARKTAA